MLIGLVGRSLCRIDESHATGDVSAVTPYRYFRLLFSVALGVFSGEQLTFAMLLGSVLIVISSLFIRWQGQQVNRLS